MDSSSRKFQGICLLSGALLLIATMVLHPAGGSMEWIVKIKSIIIGSHSLALFSLPFIAYGFWGLAASLRQYGQISWLSFSVSCFAVIAAMIAGSINGIVLPLFLSSAADSVEHDLLRTVTRYGMFINMAMDFILIAGIILSMLIWSLLMTRKQNVVRWLGWYGVMLAAAGLAGFLLGFNYISVPGFSLFIFGIASWILLTSWFVLIRKQE